MVTSRVITYTLGLILLLLGGVTLFYPQIMARYGIEANTAHATMSIRSLIAGAEIGLALFMLFGGKLGIRLQSRLWLAFCVFGGVAFIRLGLVFFHLGSSIPDMVLRELIAEIIIILFIIIGLLRSREH